MISAGLQFQHGVPKIKALTQFCYVMMSSDDSLTTDMIIKGVQSKIAGRPLTVAQIVQLFSEECISFKARNRERDVLFPLGLNYSTLAEGLGDLPREVANGVISGLLDYDYDFRSDFLIFGLDIDPIAAHIYVVNQDGEFKLYDYLGFAVIGSGYNTAFPELTRMVWHQGITMVEAIVRVYNAKKAAERMGGVGEFTDLYVLHIPSPEKEPKVAGLWQATPAVMKRLEDGRKELNDTEQAAYAKVVLDVVSIIQKSIADEQAKTQGTAQPSSSSTQGNEAVKT